MLRALLTAFMFFLVLRDTPLRAGTLPAPALVGTPQAVRLFYQRRHGEPAWNAGSAKVAIATLSRAGADGLDPSQYSFAASGDAGRDDVSLTMIVLTYMRDLAGGRPELQSVDADIGLSLRTIDVAGLLDEALASGNLADLLKSLAPAHPGYMALKHALAVTTSLRERDVLAVNMERWRWLPEQLEPDRIEVNAATAELTLFLGGQPVMTSRVIVGKPGTRTPILRADGVGVTVNPAWNVPHSIAVKEILPKLKRDHTWLASQDMVLLNGPPGDLHGLSVNWRAIPAGTFPYRIRQTPGARNPLGQVKLELPNRFDVYLHDTPGKASFNRSNRALSHGCIRVEQILPLASYALAADQTAMRQIQDAIGQGETQYFPLRRKLPIYVLYWTAFPGPDGTIQFAKDLYGRDKRMIAAMHQQSVRVAAIEPGCRKA